MFVVAREAATLHDPSEAALDHPASPDYDEAFLPRHATDDLQGDVGLVVRPGNEAPGIAAVRKDGFHERKAGAGAFQHALGAVAILNVGGVDLNRERAAVGVGQDVTLAPMDLLARVVTF